MNPLENLKETARRSFAHVSFSPERRGDSVVNDYGNELLEDIETIKQAAAKFDQEPAAAIARYTEKYKRYITNWLHSQSNCVSAFIAGPSNFPVRQQQKRHQWAENKYTEFREWRTRVLRKICKSFAPAVTPLTELEKAKIDLANRVALQAMYHRINKAYNAYVKKPETLEVSDLPDKYKAVIRHFDPQRQWYKKPIAPFEFSNNNANIKRLEGRVKELEAKTAKHVAGEQKEQVINGVRIVDNYEADRVQMFFDGKPAQEIIDKLKKRGWRWSPFGMCWQRKITVDAQYSAKDIAGQVKG